MEGSTLFWFVALGGIILALGFYAIYLKSMLNYSNSQLFKALRYQTVSVGITMLWFREMNLSRHKYKCLYSIIQRELSSPEGELTYRRGVGSASEWIKNKGLIDSQPQDDVDAEVFEKSLKAHEAIVANFPRTSL